MKWKKERGEWRTQRAEVRFKKVFFIVKRWWRFSAVSSGEVRWWGRGVHRGLRLGAGSTRSYGTELYTIRRAFFKENNDQYQIRYESEYLFRIRKEIQTDYKFKNYDKYKSSKKNIIFINWLTELFNNISLGFYLYTLQYLFIWWQFCSIFLLESTEG